MSQQSETKPDRAGEYETLSILAWVAVAILAINVSYFVGGEVGAVWYTDGVSFVPLFNGFMIGLLKASPTIFILLALVDFAFFFRRCGEETPFTERNLKTLRSGADSLIAAAVMSAILVPLIMGAIDDTYERNIFSFTDLALGVGLMGFALHGFAGVLKDAILLKQENDGFV